MELVHNGFSKAGNSHGYTGHEHLTWCGLVNMNARLYDPALGRFLSPDPEVQQPEGTQGFNRYTYCLNNPLRYVDLDGEKIINGYGDPKLLQAKLDFLLFSRDQTPEGISKENINNEITKLTHTLKDAIESQNMIDDYKMTDPVGFEMIDNILEGSDVLQFLPGADILLFRVVLDAFQAF